MAPGRTITLKRVPLGFVRNTWTSPRYVCWRPSSLTSVTLATGIGTVTLVVRTGHVGCESQVPGAFGQSGIGPPGPETEKLFALAVAQRIAPRRTGRTGRVFMGRS